jgi:glutamine synthetase
MSDLIQEIFGVDVFNETVMKQSLPENVFASLKKTMENGDELDPAIADVVANAMKDWAIKKGATHYTHWFQPMTGITAEKHDSFIAPGEAGKVIMEFSGKELIRGESDASSFPSGGLRATFEARGYTAWDCTSPAFVKEDAAGVTLCIPTAFCSYTGEALDEKTPLLRSMDALSRESVRALKLIGKEDVTHVSVSVGPEQEYFLVDHKKYMRREDLIFTGRTLFGAPAPKGQEMDDHYYGAIKERIASYMKELNAELWKLGVLAKTQHNEVAPAQHELACIYTTANTACDHNQIVMDTMKKVAKRHGLECLLNEKPFAGVNGSGKHDNWSVVTNLGENLLKPGKEPHKNLAFLIFLSAVIAAVDDHALLLRCSASTPGNDNRLGGSEAPPTVISVFLGAQLDDIVHQIIETGTAQDCKKKETMLMGVSSLPKLRKDVTDRNRTSPFAFTGNKFEFRSVGSSDSIGSPNTVLNTIVAESFCEAADILEKADDLNVAVHDLIKKYLTEHQRIIFNGDGYSEKWVEEAARRGLPNLKSMVDAVDTLKQEKTVRLFEKFGIFTRTELESRAEVLYENYARTVNIEAHAMTSMASKQIIPAVMAYAGSLADTVNSMKAAGVEPTVPAKLLKQINADLTEMQEALENMKNHRKTGIALSSQKERAFYFKDHVVPAMEALRAPADRLEKVVDKEFWPLPTYAELMFEV